RCREEYRSDDAAAAAQADALCRPAPARRRADDVPARRAGVGGRTRPRRSRRAVMTAPEFLELLDLASERLGAAAIAADDDFFASRDNLIKLAPPIWRDGEYTDRGKWMDGWETRRRRDATADSHDWCIVRLGVRGIVKGVDVETTFFKGNFPESCAIDGGD